MHRFAALAACFTLCACATAPGRNDVLGTADLRLADGRSAGLATLVAAGETVQIDIAATDLPPGARAVHLHTTGQCTPPDFQSAGAHLNPFNRNHGLAAPSGAHLGDLPNLQVSPDGTARGRFALTGGQADLLPYLFDSDGTAVVIHAQADDNVTDPSGNAGGRIVCGVMKRSG